MVCTTAARVLVCRAGAIYRGSRDTDLEMEGRIRTARGGGEGRGGVICGREDQALQD